MSEEQLYWQKEDYEPTFEDICTEWENQNAEYFQEWHYEVLDVIEDNKSVFNAVSAYTAKCGTICFTYESNQGIGGESLCYTPDVIYKHHMLLFEECFEYAKNYIAGMQYK